LASLNWILLSGLRHISIGADTYVYKVYNFDISGNRTWDEIFNSFWVYFKGESLSVEPGYRMFERVIQIFTSNYQVYLIVIAIVFTVSLGKWIYKNSREPLISFLLYSVLFYSFFAITGHRQTIATALVLLIGYERIKKKQLFVFLGLVVVAFTIHKSAIAFLPFYFLANKKITKNYLITMLAIFPVIFFLRFQLMSLLVNIVGYESYLFQYEGAGTWTFTLILLLVFGVTVWKHKTILSTNPRAIHYVNALILAVFLTPLTFINPSAMRVVQYYSLFLMLLIPDIILSFNKKERVIVYYVATGLLLLLFIRNNPSYLFFWQ
jgi:transmembrane protein EpsG